MLETQESTKPKLGPPSYYMRIRTVDLRNSQAKTAVLYDETIIPPGIEKENFACDLNQSINEVEGNRPVAKLGSPRDTPNKRPRSVYTPGGTRLDLEKSYGVMEVFSDRKVVELNQLTCMASVEAEKRLVQSQSHIKKQELVITPELLAAARAKKEVRGTGGIPTQNKVMAAPGVPQAQASANQIASLLGLKHEKQDINNGEPDLDEWLHLLMYSWLKRKAQDPANLSGGKRKANTDMMHAEEVSTNLVDRLGGEILVKVEAHEMGCHFAKEIRYTIITKNFTLPFVFNAQTTVTPTSRYRNYLHALVTTLINKTTAFFDGDDSQNSKVRKKIDFDAMKEDSEKEKESIQPTKNISLTQMPILFYKRRKTDGDKEKLVEPHLQNVSTNKPGC